MLNDRSSLPKRVLAATDRRSDDMEPTTTHHFAYVVMPDRSAVVALVDTATGEIVSTAHTTEWAA